MSDRRSARDERSVGLVVACSRCPNKVLTSAALRVTVSREDRATPEHLCPTCAKKHTRAWYASQAAELALT